MSNSIKMFMWCACHEALPTRVNLMKRKLLNTNLCPLCGLEGEAVSHILWTCPYTSDVWFLCSMKFQKSGIFNTNFGYMIRACRFYFFFSLSLPMV